MANDLNFTQIGSVLTEVVRQATGQNVLAPVDTSSFVTVGQIGLKAGYDAMATALSQVLTRTIWSIRPYSRKLDFLNVSEARFGNHVRKVSPVDIALEDDDRYKLEQGESVDMYEVNKPHVQQLNFYGGDTYQAHITIYRDQIDTALQSPADFGSFISMILGNINNQIEQVHESIARMSIANLAGGAIDIGYNHTDDKSGSVVFCRTEYNDEHGTTYSEEELLTTQLESFAKWLFAKIAKTSNLMTERSAKYHVSIGGQQIMRHTPFRNQRLIMHGGVLSDISANVYSSIFNPNFIKYAPREEVNFWQSIDDAMTINVTPSYPDKTGMSIVTGNRVTKPILAVLFDDEALGYTTINRWEARTPFNARGGYSNLYWHFTDRYWNDFTENHVVFVLE